MINYKKLSGVGVVGFGAYLPRYRIKVSEIEAGHGIRDGSIGNNLKVYEKSVANWDEDAATMAYMASKKALDMARVGGEKIGALYVGSESHPYAVKATSSIVGEALGIGSSYMAADLEFACKAGTAGIQIVASQVVSGVVDYGIAIGADKAQAEVRDALEYTAAAGAAAVLVGRKRILAKLCGFFSYTSDTNDFWRRSGEKYPAHAGRFTGEPAYFKHVVESTKLFFKVSSTKAEDYDQVVFHMPNGKFPYRAAERLGISKRQMELGMVVGEIGNPYSASSLMGLCQVLGKAKLGDRILLTSYGSGAGSDTFAFEISSGLNKRNKMKVLPSEAEKRYLSYGEYLFLSRGD